MSADLPKPVATLRAKLALAGWSLTPLPSGAFLAGRWGRTVDLPDLDAVARFYRLVAGKQA